MMNNDRDTAGTDPRVSEVYRELASERAPRALNDRILRRAAAAEPVRSLVPGGWMKPVARAATIGLSLAIVLQLTQLPQTPLETDGVLAPGTADDPALLAPSRNDRPAAAGTGDSGNKSGSTAPVVVSEERAELRRAGKPDLHRAELPVTAEAAAPAMTLAPKPAAPMDEQTAADGLSGLAGEFADRPAMTTGATECPPTGEPLLCQASARETPEDWYRCIESQRAVSAAGAIEHELDALRQRFPDFALPDPDK